MVIPQKTKKTQNRWAKRFHPKVLDLKVKAETQTHLYTCVQSSIIHNSQREAAPRIHQQVNGLSVQWNITQP